MIARLWRGAAGNRADAEAYVRHVRANVAPALKAIPGYRELRLLRREEGGRTEFLVMTLWDTMDAIHRFAGEDAEHAVVEPEARAVLADCDDFVRHYEVEP